MKAKEVAQYLIGEQKNLHEDPATPKNVATTALRNRLYLRFTMRVDFMKATRNGTVDVKEMTTWLAAVKRHGNGLLDWINPQWASRTIRQ